MSPRSPRLQLSSDAAVSVDGRSWSLHFSETRSEQFVNRVDRTLSAAVAARNRDQMVQECAGGGCSFEPRRRPKIVGGRVDRLAAGESLDHGRRALAQAE